MNHHSSRPWMCACALLLALGAPAAAADAPQQFAFDLPAEPLSDALREIALRTGRNVIVPGALVEARRSPPLAGTFTAEEAVARLLAGSGLRYRLVGGTLVIEPVPAAIGAADQPSGIVVTGTHVRGAAPTSPLITLSRRQIDELAPASVEQLMRSLPQNVPSGVSQENFNVSGAGSDITDHGAGINLRGLGQRATLVLVNGRRVAPSGLGSFVDVSMIPVSAIERVEILTDGASAIYGSDAVGGVVNLVLRDRFEGLDALVQAGAATDGGGGQLLAGVTGGHQWGSGRALISYEYRRDDEIRASQRAFTIGLPADWSLFPRERRQSVYANIKQQLGSRLSLELSGFLARRLTDRSYFMAGPALPVDAHATARTIGGTAALRLDLGASWAAELSGNAFRARSEESQFQSPGIGLVNRYNMTNAIAELGLKLDGNLIELPGGPAKLAVGAQERWEDYSSLFETPVNPVTLQSGSRTVKSAYGELYVPLVGARNAMPGLRRLVLTGAGRFEDYARLGSSFDPKVGLLWAPVDELGLRASYGTSFRAPLLSETFGIYNVYLFDAAVLSVDPATAPHGVAAALVGTNPAVGPERSKSLSMGAEWTPRAVSGLSLRATYYRIDFSNRIALPADDIVVIGNPAFASIVTLNPQPSLVGSLFAGANQLLDISGPGFTNGGATASDVVAIVDARYANTAETRTSGLDLGLDYGFRLGGGEAHAELNANRVFRFDDRLAATSPVIHELGTPFHPVSWRARGGLSWARGPWSSNLFVNYTAPYRDNRPGIDRPVDAFVTLDAGLAYSLEKSASAALRGLRIAFNVQNLLDADPPALLPGPGTTRGIGYDPVNATGRGRSLSLQLRKLFK